MNWLTFLYAFLFAGGMCLIGQLLYDFTKLTPGHITSIFVVGGVLFETCGIYDKLVEWCGGGAMTPITNFGHLLAHAAVEGARNEGFIGILKNMLVPVSGVLVFVVVMAIFASLVTRPKSS